MDRQKFYSIAVRQTDILEIESYCTAFSLQQCPKRLHVIPCNPTADAQNHTILSDCLAVDFASHVQYLSGRVSELASLEKANLVPLVAC